MAGEPSLGWTVQCSEGKTGNTSIGDDDDRELHESCIDSGRWLTREHMEARRKARPPAKRHGRRRGNVREAEAVIIGPDGMPYRFHECVCVHKPVHAHHGDQYWRPSDEYVRAFIEGAEEVWLEVHRKL